MVKCDLGKCPKKVILEGVPKSSKKVILEGGQRNDFTTPIYYCPCLIYNKYINGGNNMKNKRYSDEFKLQVVKDYLNSTQGYRTIAEKYNLPSKNYIHDWELYLIRKGLLSEEETNKTPKKTYSLKSNNASKTPYEKQLEKENFRLKAELAFYQELKRLIDEDNKKK
jgi:transposase-like protein